MSADTMDPYTQKLTRIPLLPASLISHFKRKYFRSLVSVLMQTLWPSSLLIPAPCLVPIDSHLHGLLALWEHGVNLYARWQGSLTSSLKSVGAGVKMNSGPETGKRMWLYLINSPQSPAHQFFISYRLCWQSISLPPKGHHALLTSPLFSAGQGPLAATLISFLWKEWFPGFWG